MYTMGSRQRMLYQEASYIMERITWELRDAQVVSGGTGILTINKVHGTGMDSATTVTFLKDSDGNMLRRSGGVDRIMGRKVDNFEPWPPDGCLATSSYCRVTITLQLTDPNIPVVSGQVEARWVRLTKTVSPRNFTPSPASDAYKGRYFNGHYEDVVQ